MWDSELDSFALKESVGILGKMKKRSSLGW